MALKKKKTDREKLNKLVKKRTKTEQRLEKLKSTDWMAVNDYSMPNYIKTWRQNLRDLPQDNTTESQYDELLAKDGNKYLTHSIWKQPTS